jgi:simple sugar transport system substrate-binding protein
VKSNKIFRTLVLVLLVTVSVTFLGCVKDSAKKNFSGIRVIFFNGGPVGDSFATVVYNGARAAEKDLGCKVEYVWSDWDTYKMALQFKEAIDKSPDAICMMGHPGSGFFD